MGYKYRNKRTDQKGGFGKKKPDAPFDGKKEKKDEH